MYIGIEWRTTKVNGKKYWRLAPIVIASEKQKLWLGSFAVLAAFILSIIILNLEKAS